MTDPRQCYRKLPEHLIRRFTLYLKNFLGMVSEEWREGREGT